MLESNNLCSVPERANLYNRKQLLDSRVIAIDDEEIIIDMIGMYLTRAGYGNVHGFTDPEEAFDTLQFVQPDLIITDVYMPNVSGSFLTRMCRTLKHLEHVPVLVVTSDERFETHDRLAIAGVDSVLTKPVDEKALVQRVDQVLQLHRNFCKMVAEKESEEQEAKTEGQRRALQMENRLRKFYRSPGDEGEIA